MIEKIVRIKALKDPKNTWSGFVRYKNTKDYVTPYYDSMGIIVTGLTSEDEDRLGKQLNKDLKRNSPFWTEYNVIMTEKDRILDLSNPEHELMYKFLVAHKRVAPSETEKNLRPSAEYVIYNEETEAKVKNEKFSVKRKAVTLFNELSLEQMRDILKLYPGFVRVESVSSDIVESKLYELMEGDPSKFIQIVEDKKLDMKVLLKDLVSAKILRKNRSAYYYGSDAIGHDDESTISYLEDPTNNSLLINLKKELESKK